MVREGADGAAAILDLAGEGEPEIGAVLGALQQAYTTLRIGNEPEDSGAFPVLESRGFVTVNHRLQLLGGTCPAKAADLPGCAGQVPCLVDGRALAAAHRGFAAWGLRS